MAYIDSQRKAIPAVDSKQYYTLLFRQNGVAKFNLFNKLTRWKHQKKGRGHAPLSVPPYTPLYRVKDVPSFLSLPSNIQLQTEYADDLYDPESSVSPQSVAIQAEGAWAGERKLQISSGKSKSQVTSSPQIQTNPAPSNTNT